jgi:hypothetical protein
MIGKVIDCGRLIRDDFRIFEVSQMVLAHFHEIRNPNIPLTLGHSLWINENLVKAETATLVI